MTSGAPWPAVAGSYEVGDAQAPVAACTLTSEDLIAPLARLPGVAIAGKVYTANLGIERIVVNITANPAIRFFLICGKDSPLFHPGQSLVALAERGVDEQRCIVGAVGYDPVLPTLAIERITQFRRQVEVLDWTGEADLQALAEGIGGLLARNPGRFAGGEETADKVSQDEQFIPIRPGGQREPLQYDPKGYFVITVDREEEQILLRHYLPDHTPAHEMRGRVAGSMLLGLLREGLVTQLSHAGYLGEELAKAQTALHLGLRYDQDRPLRPREVPSQNPSETPAIQESHAPDATPLAPAPAMPRMSQIAPPITAAQPQATAPGATVDVALAVNELPAPDILHGIVLDPDEAEPFGTFRRAPQLLQIHWTPATKIVMGSAADLQTSALVRARGPLGEDHVLEAQQLVILTRVAGISEG